MALKTRNNYKENVRKQGKLKQQQKGAGPGAAAAAADDNNNKKVKEEISFPDCCTYEQVYSRIIELLNKTSGAGSLGADQQDLTLSRAILEELEVGSFVFCF